MPVIDIPRPTSRTFAEVLEDARSRAGLSQTDLARKAGCSTSIISLYESGQRLPQYTSVLVLAGVMGLSTTATDEMLIAAGYRERVVDRIVRRLLAEAEQEGAAS